MIYDLPIKNGWIFPWRTVSHNQKVIDSYQLAQLISNWPGLKLAEDQIQAMLEEVASGPSHMGFFHGSKMANSDAKKHEDLSIKNQQINVM